MSIETYPEPLVHALSPSEGPSANFSISFKASHLTVSHHLIHFIFLIISGENQLLQMPKHPLIPPQPSPSITSSCDNFRKDMASKRAEPYPSSDNGNVWFRMQFRTVCEICVLMPLLGLVACLIVALLFQFDHIQETACKVSLNTGPLLALNLLLRQPY